MRWKSLRYIHREFSYVSTGERILKIGPHLPKLLTNIKWLTFFETLQCMYSVSVLYNMCLFGSVVNFVMSQIFI